MRRVRLFPVGVTEMWGPAFRRPDQSKTWVCEEQHQSDCALTECGEGSGGGSAGESDPEVGEEDAEGEGG